MGDADNVIVRGQLNEIEPIVEDLDLVRDQLTLLNATLFETQQRLARHVREHMRANEIFLDYVIAMNFVLIPAFIALGLSYMMKNMNELEFESQDVLQFCIQYLWFISACIGIPFYFASLFVIFNFFQEERSADEFSNLEMEEEINDYGLAMLMRQMANPDEIEDNERIENQPVENSDNETNAEDGEFVDSLFNQELILNDSNMQAVMQNIDESVTGNSVSAREGLDNDTVKEEDNTSVIHPSQETGVLVARLVDDTVT